MAIRALVSRRRSPASESRIAHPHSRRGPGSVAEKQNCHWFSQRCAMTLRCHWCERKCAPGRAGKPKKFCAIGCKRQYENALRSHTLAELDNGNISIEELRRRYSQGGERM